MSRAWLVGGAVRDELLGRATKDADVVVDGDAEAYARQLAKQERGAAFPLGDAFGAWRVVVKREGRQVDVTPLRGGTIEADLALRDFTVNAMARPLPQGSDLAFEHGAGLQDLTPGVVVDPFGGRDDLAAGRLRAVGPRAFADDPLRVVRLARFAETLGLTPDRDTVAAARHTAPQLGRVAGERVFAELRHLLTPTGVERLRETGALAVVLPEVEALRGLEQTVYHHKDAYGHTLEVLEHAIALRDADLVPGVEALLAEPLADESTRGDGLRWAALLHDVAKPHTAVPSPKGGFGFPGHDSVGAGLARAVLAERLRTSAALADHVAALTRHHLRLGFLVRRQPLDRRTLYGYLVACAPVAADVTLLTVADRLATRGRKSGEAIARHLQLARAVLPEALAWHRDGPPRPLLRGDELGLPPGPEVGRVLAALVEAQFAGEVTTREEARAYAAAASRRTDASTTRTQSATVE